MHNANIGLLKQEVGGLVRSDFEGSLFNYVKPDAFVLALLEVLGFYNVKVVGRGGLNEFVLDVYGSEVLLLTVDFFKETVAGRALEDLKKAFYLVCAIEGELTDAMEYPQELRRRIIDATVCDSGADLEFYRKVLRNWKEYS